MLKNQVENTFYFELPNKDSFNNMLSVAGKVLSSNDFQCLKIKLYKNSYRIDLLQIIKSVDFDPTNKTQMKSFEKFDDFNHRFGKYRIDFNHNFENDYLNNSDNYQRSSVITF